MCVFFLLFFLLLFFCLFFCFYFLFVWVFFVCFLFCCLFVFLLLYVLPRVDPFSDWTWCAENQNKKSEKIISNVRSVSRRIKKEPLNRPASMAQLDVRPTGDQEVAGSTPAEVGNILSGSLIMKYFLRPFSDSNRAVVSFWRKNVHNTG